MSRRVNMLFKRNQAQAFVQDLIISLFIIAIFFVVFLNYETNRNYDEIDNAIVFEVKAISDNLMSEGFPKDWNSTSVKKLGITNGENVLNITKLDMFYNMTQSEYDRSRLILGANDDFVVFFADKSGNIINVSSSEYFGKPGFNVSTIENENPGHLSRISRFVVLKSGSVNVTSTIIEMRVYVWKKM